jgi:hypothetical protein
VADEMRPDATRAAAATLTKGPKKQPKEFAGRLSAEEWAAIHSDDPSSVYELRPNAWRPLQAVFGKDQPPCPNCGATVQEMISPDASRCLGCGQSPAKN